jgi:hypothetical protein
MRCDISEIDLFQMFQSFRIIVKLVILHDKNHAFLQIQDVISTINVLQYYTSVQLTIRGRSVYVQFSSHQELTTMDQNTFKEVKCSSLTKFEISSGKKQEVSFKENEVKFDSLNNKKYCLL